MNWPPLLANYTEQCNTISVFELVLRPRINIVSNARDNLSVSLFLFLMINRVTMLSINR